MSQVAVTADAVVKLEMRNVSKIFHSREGAVLALQNTDLRVATNEFVSIVGPSGCGKSTLLHLAAGLEQPTAGEILVNGRPAGRPGPDRCMVFQQFALFPSKTVAANIEFGLRIAGVARVQRMQIVEEQIARIGLMGFEDHYPHQLSGGMQQRVAIARALALQPDILLMDEPFGALDAQTRILMQEEIANVYAEEKLTVLFVTHSVEEAIYLSNRVIVMTARPGSIKRSIEVPRNSKWIGQSVDEAYSNAEFTQLREVVWRSVREEIGDLRNIGRPKIQ